MRTTESSSLHDSLETKSTEELLFGINSEDHKVASAVKQILPQIGAFVDEAFLQMKQGGRLFYIGAGTSGRLGILDASECPPTFGVDHGVVVGLIAGGDSAIRKAVENAEDDATQAWNDLKEHEINADDIVVGIAASGTTPYVIGGVEKAREHGLLTAAITCNQGSPLGKAVQHELAAVVGPEFVTGSTRMKSGTAQKMVLNMISTSLMIKMGHVQGNKMVDMQLSNDKLIDRGTRRIMEETGASYDLAKSTLLSEGSVRAAVNTMNDAKK